MADKGFDIKVLIPTDDGLTISNKGIEKAAYYLMYNVSNRSYQLAEKIKFSELFTDQQFDTSVLEKFCNQNSIDIIVNPLLTEFKIKIKVIHETQVEIGEVLNHFIDQIDEKHI